MSYAETSTHCGIVGDIQLRRDAVYGVWIVSTLFCYYVGYYVLNPVVEESKEIQFQQLSTKMFSSSNRINVWTVAIKQLSRAVFFIEI